MNIPFAEVYLTGNTTVAGAPAAGAVIPLTWTAGAGQHGEGSCSISTAGKATCKPGVYEFHFEGSVEGPLTSDSATSGDTTGELSFVFFRGGSVVTGAKVRTDDLTDGAIDTVGLTKIIEITAAHLEAETNYVEVAVIGGDASGNDYLLKEGRFIVKRLS